MNNKGFSIIGAFIYMILFGFITFYGFQIGLGFLDKSTLQKTLQSSLLEAQQENNLNPMLLQESILRKLKVGTIEINPENIFIEDTSNGFNVEIEYYKNIKITKYISLVINLSVNESSPN